MKKILCCILALTTFFAVGATSCAPAGEGSSVETVAGEYELSWRRQTYNIEDGQTTNLRIHFTVGGEDADVSLLEFLSSDENIVTVSEDGDITGVSGGTAYITVSYGETSLQATVNVTARTHWIELSEEKTLLLKGNDKQITATAHFGKGEYEQATLSWQSSDPSVVTVEDGLLSAKEKGTADITVSYEHASETIRVSVVEEIAAEDVNSFDEKYVNIYGRSYLDDGALNLDHASNAVEIGIIGTSLTVNVSATNESYMRVVVDDEVGGQRIAVKRGRNAYKVAEDLDEGLHSIRIIKTTEESDAQWDVYSFEATKFFEMPEKSDFKIEFIGDSIATGYGVRGFSNEERTVANSDSTWSYSYLTAKELNADYSVIGWGGIATKAFQWSSSLNMDMLYSWVSNSNKTEYTFTPDTDVVVINLGTNDAHYLEYTDTTYSEQFIVDYQNFLMKVRANNPNAYIICLYGMMRENNVIKMGIQTAIANMNDDDIVFNPFEFEGNLEGAGQHPSMAAQKEWSEKLVAYIRGLYDGI